MGIFDRFKKPTVNTDEKAIDEALSRSVAEILPSKEGLKAKMLEGKRLRFYIGADATGPDLHLGHATNFLLLERVRRLGHEVVILFGDFTAMIGDPTDKDATRVKLSKEEVESNIRNWKAQAGKVISFGDRDNPAVTKRNSAWLANLRFNDIVDIASHFTVQHMLERDMFERRRAEDKPVYLHEFLYPLMQGYDSVAMDVDVEVGGTDQTFNMLAGRTLQKRYHGKEKFVIATTLLENPKTGTKLMNKSEGSYIALSDAPADMYGKTMALPDEVLIQMFTDTTGVPIEDIEKAQQALADGANPRDIKMRLARAIVSLYHSDDAAERAEQHFTGAFQRNAMPDDALHVSVRAGGAVQDVGKTLVEHNVVASNTEFSRLLNSGSIRDMDTGNKITGTTVFNASANLRVGKKRFVVVDIQ